MTPVCGEIVEINGTTGFERFNGIETGGYIITLKEYIVRPTGKEDIV